MIIYLLILFLLFILSILNPFLAKNRPLASRFVVVTFLLLFLLGGLRKDVGVDYVNYEHLFHMPAELYAMKEKGFIWVIELLNYWNLPFSVFCLLFIGGTLWGIYFFILSRSPYIFFSILMYYALGNYYFSAFNAVRQCLAVAIFLCLLVFIERRQLFLYVSLLGLTAFFIHASVVMLIPLYFILHRRWSWKAKVIIFVSIVGVSSSLFALIANTPYAFYVKNEDYATSVPLTYYLMLFFAIVICIYSYCNPKFEKRNLVLVNLNVIAFLFLFLIFAYENTVMVKLLSRVLNYFTVAYIVLVPILIAEFKLLTNRFILISIFTCCFAFLSFWALYQNGYSNKMIPYKTVLI